MKIGLFGINFGVCGDPDAMVRVARAAEEAGLTEGEAALVQQQAGSATAAGAAGARTMQIGGVRLPMFDRAQRAALKAGVRYRVYYLRGPAPRVMAVELI